MRPEKFDDDLLVSHAVEHRLDAEAGFNIEDHRYWVVRVRQNGMVISRSRGLDPDIAYQVAATDIAVALNHHIRHDGAWIVAWTDWFEPDEAMKAAGEQGRPTRMICMWMDWGGDIQFTVEIDDPFWLIVDSGIPHWINQCQQAWQLWHHSMRVVLEPTADELYMRARGERPKPANPRRH